MAAPSSSMCPKAKRNGCTRRASGSTDISSGQQRNTDGCTVGDHGKFSNTWVLCSGANNTYYTGLFESVLRQSDLFGTVHPNTKGHVETAKKIKDVYDGPKPDWRPRVRIQLNLDSVRITDLREPPDSDTDLLVNVKGEWDRLPKLVETVPIKVGTPNSFEVGNIAYVADLAIDDGIVVRARSQLPDDWSVPPSAIRRTAAAKWFQGQSWD